MQDIRFLETHTDVFFNGKNFGKKLKPSEILKLKWDSGNRWVDIYWNGRIGHIMESNIAFFESDDGRIIEEPKNEHRTEHVAGRKKAQVATPMDHVFRGEGHGKVRQ